MLGKAEGEGKLWHGHVTAVTVAPESRRLGLATKLMNILEETTEKVYVPLCPFALGVLSGAPSCALEGLGPWYECTDWACGAGTMHTLWICSFASPTSSQLNYTLSWVIQPIEEC